MKTLPAGMQAHLDSGATTLCWCWRLQRADTTVYGFTDHDRDLIIEGVTYEAASGFTASEVKSSLGLSVDDADAAGALSSARINEADLAGGMFDDARIEIWRVNWADTAQRVLMMSGSIGEVRRGDAAFTAELRSLAHYLNQEQGRTYQYACDATLGDARCGVAVASATYTGTGAVTAVEAGWYKFATSGLGGYAAEWFTGGLLTWTSGANIGRQMEVKGHALSGAVATLELWRSMSSAVTAGDAFTVVAGCDKTFATCRDKFANQANFRGFPYIPGSAYMIQVAKDSAASLYSGRSMFNG
jgi:uncharacterized phage protein (TIGR02218 family)